MWNMSGWDFANGTHFRRSWWCPNLFQQQIFFLCVTLCWSYETLYGDFKRLYTVRSKKLINIHCYEKSCMKEVKNGVFFFGARKPKTTNTYVSAKNNFPHISKCFVLTIKIYNSVVGRDYVYQVYHTCEFTIP